MPDLSQRLFPALAGRYRIERELGRGGMATVFLAEDLKHHRRVALKVLDPEVAAAIGPERFLREIEIAAKLDHPHILPLFDSGQADGLLFYVMPYIEGESLRQRLEREKQLPVEHVLRIDAELADGLGHAHGQGIVHRDVKPENVLFAGGHALLADFGIARALGAAGPEKLTQTGVTMGTPAYMSPEQAAGQAKVDARSDQYALACVVYEMLAGLPPFTGPTAESIAHQHLSVPPHPVTELRPTVTRAMAAAIAKALAKSPADRYGSVGDFAAALAEGAKTPSWTSPWWRRRPTWAAAAVLTIIFVTLWFVRDLRKPSPAPDPTHHRAEVAVLPFQNLSVEGPNAYFAGGLHEELLTQLAKVAALKVISRTSVMGYSGTTKPLKQIAAELGVGSIVEGSVQVAGNRLRVNVQLIDAETDEHLWAERYDRTLDDAFAIQSDVAQRIVAAVGVALGTEEERAISRAPTASSEAYQLYLQGDQYHRKPGFLRENLEIAQHLYERALALDPDFALAHAALSQTHGRLYWYGYDPSPTRAALQRTEAEIALRLSPSLPQAHQAMGLVYYFGHREYERALKEHRIALRDLPNDALAWVTVAAIQRRLGNWAGVDMAYRRAILLDPRNALALKDLGGQTQDLLHHYGEAVKAYDRARVLAPDFHEVAVLRGRTFVLWRSDLDTLRAALDGIPEDASLGGEGNAAGWQARYLLWAHKSDDLIAHAARHRGEIFESQLWFLPAALYADWASQLRGDMPGARTAFESALKSLELGAGQVPDDFRARAARGLTFAGLGRKAAALREAHWLQKSEEYRRDVLIGPEVREQAALIFAQVGEAGAALDEIERLLTGPSWFSVHALHLDPRWDPIRDDPRFKALLVKYADPEKWAVKT